MFDETSFIIWSLKLLRPPEFCFIAIYLSKSLNEAMNDEFIKQLIIENNI